MVAIGPWTLRRWCRLFGGSVCLYSCRTHYIQMIQFINVTVLCIFYNINKLLNFFSNIVFFCLLVFFFTFSCFFFFLFFFVIFKLPLSAPRLAFNLLRIPFRIIVKVQWRQFQATINCKIGIFIYFSLKCDCQHELQQVLTVHIARINFQFLHVDLNAPGVRSL